MYYKVEQGVRVEGGEGVRGCGTTGMAKPTHSGSEKGISVGLPPGEVGMGPAMSNIAFPADHGVLGGLGPAT